MQERISEKCARIGRHESNKIWVRKGRKEKEIKEVRGGAMIEKSIEEEGEENVV